MPRFPTFGYPYPYYYRRQGFSNPYHLNYGYSSNTENMSNQTSESKSGSSLESRSNRVSENLPISKDFKPANEEEKDEDTRSKETRSYKKNKSRYNNPINSFLFQNPSSIDLEHPIFELLGIKLYLDDLIILGLLFFLYKEGVKDDMLFLSLIMLLLS